MLSELRNQLKSLSNKYKNIQYNNSLLKQNFVDIISNIQEMILNEINRETNEERKNKLIEYFEKLENLKLYKINDK